MIDFSNRRQVFVGHTADLSREGSPFWRKRFSLAGQQDHIMCVGETAALQDFSEPVIEGDGGNTNIRIPLKLSADL